MALFDAVNAVMEGGGAKGSAFVGALSALKERSRQPRPLFGTSPGAITATFFAAGVLSSFPIRLIPESVSELMGDTDPNGALHQTLRKFAGFRRRAMAPLNLI